MPSQMDIRRDREREGSRKVLAVVENRIHPLEPADSLGKQRGTSNQETADKAQQLAGIHQQQQGQGIQQAEMHIFLQSQKVGAVLRFVAVVVVGFLPTSAGGSH
jgi:hypothetical protein